MAIVANIYTEQYLGISEHELLGQPNIIRNSTIANKRFYSEGAKLNV